MKTPNGGFPPRRDCPGPLHTRPLRAAAWTGRLASLGPARIVGGTALSQVWLFIVAPLIGGLAAAGLYRVLYPELDPGRRPQPASPPVAG